MVHKHSVRDTNAHFTIDQFTRQIKNSSTEKTTIVQYDHNSQRLTFSMPLQIDSHAMTLCDLIEIHFINISTDGKKQNDGVYEVNDIKAEGDNAVFTWLISQEATQLAGTLNFFIVFKCTENGVTVYRWGTEICKTLSVSEGMDNGETVLTEYPDILAQWKAQLFDASDTAVVNVATAESSALAAIEAAGEAKKQAVLDSIPDEYEELSALADQNHRNKAGAIVVDAEGESIVVNDASDCYLQGLKLFGKSTQDGTPTPDAPVDIVSVENPVVTVCGKNLLNLDLLIDDNFVKNADGSYTMTKTGIGDLRFSAKANLRLGKGTYTLSVGNLSGTDTAVRFVFTHANGQEVSHSITPTNPKTIHVTDNITKFSVYISTSLADGTYVTMRDVMLEVGDKVTDYEPYKNIQTIQTANTLPGIPVSSGGNYTDANGQQWICDEVDLARGVYVQRVYELVSDYTDGWKISGNSTTNHNAFYRMNTALPTMIKGTNQPVICTHFTMTRDPVADHTICVSGGLSNQEVYFFVPKTEFPNEETWANYVVEQAYAGTPITTHYILSTPIETPLSDAEINAFRGLHSNKPNTTILNDAGAHMAASYVADTKTYIDNKIADLLSNIE